MPYKLLYDNTITDIDRVIQILKEWQEMYSEQDISFQVNIGILTNKIVNYACKDLERECKEGFQAFLEETGYEQQDK